MVQAEVSESLCTFGMTERRTIEPEQDPEELIIEFRYF